MSSLPVSDIVNVSVYLTPTTPVGQEFDLGLIVGQSTVIAGTTADRVRVYSSLAGMITDGFTDTDPEYLAAQLYFSQSPKPAQVAIGRWISGTETAAAAVTACRAANTNWYGCTVCGAVDADIEGVAAYIEAASPFSAYFATTSDAAVLAGTAGNVALTLQAAGYTRTLLQYSTYQDAAASILGYAMGANTQAAGSAYTLAFKSEPGVTPEALTEAQVTTLQGQNCNYYVTRGNTYNTFEQGVMASGMWFDERLGLDELASGISTAIMGQLTSNTKVPQTEGGMTLLKNAIDAPCRQAVATGFLAPGVWTGAAIQNLSTGDMLPLGYLIQSQSIASQSETDRTARKAPPISVALKLAGAVQNASISVYVQE